jgi:hypothetical protein
MTKYFLAFLYISRSYIRRSSIIVSNRQYQHRHVVLIIQYTKQVVYILLLIERVINITAMLGSYRLLVLVKLILFELLGLSKFPFFFLFICLIDTSKWFLHVQTNNQRITHLNRLSCLLCHRHDIRVSDNNEELCSTPDEDISSFLYSGHFSLSLFVNEALEFFVITNI